MRIVRFGPAEISTCWPWLSKLLAPAVAVDPNGSIETLKASLDSGAMGLASVHADKTAGLVVVHPVELNGVFCLWLPYIAGQVGGGPKQWLRTMRAILAHFETEAVKAGCAEVRIGGRNYRKIFPDYEPFDPAWPNRLRKVLPHG